MESNFKSELFNHCIFSINWQKEYSYPEFVTKCFGPANCLSLRITVLSIIVSAITFCITTGVRHRNSHWRYKVRQDMNHYQKAYVRLLRGTQTSQSMTNRVKFNVRAIHRLLWQHRTRASKSYWIKSRKASWWSWHCHFEGWVRATYRNREKRVLDRKGSIGKGMGTWHRNLHWNLIGTVLVF